MQELIGGLVIYIGVILIVPYLLLKYAPFSLFITWFANVDIVSNILSINYPDYFKRVYDINPKTLSEYLSYNTISLVALSGIFIHGLRQHKENKLKTFITMVIMSIVTWTLPTQGIPIVNKKIDEYILKNNVHIDKDSFKREKLLITIIISVCFIILEWFIIHFLVNSLSPDVQLPSFLRNL